MKMLNKIAIKVSIILSLVLALTSCQDPILYNIKKEVKLESASILGEIYSIVRFTDGSTEKLYVANGNIYSKKADDDKHGSWEKMGAPSGHVHSLAADSTYLYAFVWTHNKDTGISQTELATKMIYYSDDKGKTWKKNLISEDSEKKIRHTKENQEIILMCTNSTNKANRQAFVRIDSTVYKLNGSSYSATSYPSNSCSCVSYKNGNAIFFPSFASCTNKNDDIIYYSSGLVLYRNANGTPNKQTDDKISSGVRGEILSIAAMNDSVLIGTTSGAALISTVTLGEIEFKNLTSTVSTLYQNHAVLAVDPDKNAENNILYATNQVKGTGSNSAQFSHEGLWSYYPSRGKWNIE